MSKLDFVTKTLQMANRSFAEPVPLFHEDMEEHSYFLVRLKAEADIFLQPFIESALVDLQADHVSKMSGAYKRTVMCVKSTYSLP